MIKAVFFDCDGTLLSHSRNKVPESAVRALEALREKGIKVILSTGRHVSELRELKPMQGLDFDAYITLNGACSYDAGGIFDSHPIEPEDIQTVYEYLCAHPLPIQFLEETESYINLVDDTVIRAQSLIHTPVPKILPLERILNHRIYMMVPFGMCGFEKLAPSLKHVSCTWWHHHDAVDVFHSEAGKEKGMAAVMKKYGIDPSETAAFGDAMNDLTMLKTAGIGVAMGNADEALKKEAYMVTDDIDCDGVANALCRLGVL